MRIRSTTLCLTMMVGFAAFRLDAQEPQRVRLDTLSAEALSDRFERRGALDSNEAAAVTAMIYRVMQGQDPRAQAVRGSLVAVLASTNDIATFSWAARVILQRSVEHSAGRADTQAVIFRYLRGREFAKRIAAMKALESAPASIRSAAIPILASQLPAEPSEAMQKQLVEALIELGVDGIGALDELIEQDQLSTPVVGWINLLLGR